MGIKLTHYNSGFISLKVVRGCSDYKYEGHVKAVSELHSQLVASPGIENTLNFKLRTLILAKELIGDTLTHYTRSYIDALHNNDLYLGNIKYNMIFLNDCFNKASGKNRMFTIDTLSGLTGVNPKYDEDVDIFADFDQAWLNKPCYVDKWICREDGTTDLVKSLFLMFGRPRR